MNRVSIKGWNKTGYPKALLSIVALVGGLALFLLLASTFLVSQPIGYTVHEYFYGVDSSRKVDSNSIVVPYEDRGTSNLSVPSGHENEVVSTKSGEIENNRSPEAESQEKNEISDIESENSKDKVPELKVTREEDGNRSSSQNDAGFSKYASDNLPTEITEIVESTNNLSRTNVVDSDCDLSHGKWIHDSNGPLYTNNSCPVITQMQNCQGNGRPDKDYENWKWKPTQCDLPRFDPKKFLELMRGKTLAFIGDSVARNQMESMLCILWQVEAPKNRGNKKMQRYYFRSTSTMIVRIWSSWLVHQSTDPLDFAPADVVKLHLDKPDEVFMQYITEFDVIVLSTGHWFAKQSAYVLNNEIVGGQLWWPDKSRKQKINNIEAFGVSVESILTSMGTHPTYTGLTIVRSFSPDHYEGGEWNTGGSCTGKVRPALDSELVENGFTNIMLEKQVTGFNRALEKKTNKSKLKLLDITKAFSYRHDGHPGPYRSPDPNKITKRGPDGRPPPQDCLHWCMPGPVDTWNELVFEIIRREFLERQG
ncbi:Protein yls7 [Castilleja foliolosa]|uniref:Protein yls7 n=1 Tax=Castilleja foliolosa TaxID=1961234 RepID=A0ABD3DTN4_9LAMI